MVGRVPRKSINGQVASYLRTRLSTGAFNVTSRHYVKYHKNTPAGGVFVVFTRNKLFRLGKKMTYLQQEILRVLRRTWL